MSKISLRKYCTIVIIILFAVNIISPFAYCGGIKFGAMSAVKDKIKKLKEKKSAMPYKAVLGENTTVISPETFSYLENQQNDMYYFNTQAIQIGDLKEGNVIINTNGNGLLRKVVSVTTINSQYVVKTTTATLAEAFEQLEITLSKKLTVNDLDSQKIQHLRKGISVQGTVTDNIRIDIDNVVIYEQSGKQIVVNGSIEISPTIYTYVKVGFFKVKQADFTVEVNEQLDLEIQAEISVTKEIEIETIPFVPITVGVVVFKPELTLVAGVDGNLSVSVGIQQSSNFKVGFAYYEGTYTDIRFLDNTFSHTGPTLTASGSLKGYAGPKVGVKVYGIVGPYINANGYLRMNATASGNGFSWILYGGLEGIVGIEADLYGLLDVDYSLVFSDEEEIFSGGPPSTPTLDNLISPDDDGNYTVSWSAVSDATGYMLEENGSSTDMGNSTSKAYSSKSNGTYLYRVKAYNSYGDSDWSDYKSITVILNNSPNKPLMPNGNASGTIGTSYSYSTSATDPDGDQIYYTFDWNDGTTTDTDYVNSGENNSKSHSWSSAGTYYVKAKATDNKGASSDWSDPRGVIINTPEQFYYISDNTATSYGDTWVDSDIPDNTVGYTSNLLHVGYKYTVNNLYRESYFGVDLSMIPNNSIVNSAYLYVKVQDCDYGFDIYAARITGNWNVDSITWSNKPNHGTALDSVNLYNTETWYSWDITSAVQSWVSGTANNYGIVLYATTTNARSIWYSSNSNNIPYFYIDYTIP